MVSGSPTYFPTTSAAKKFSDLQTLHPSFAPNTQTRLLWQASIVAFPEPSTKQASHLAGASFCAETFLSTLKAAGLKSPRATTKVTLACERLRLNATFSKFGPSSKLKILREAGTPLTTANSFFRCASQLNSVRGIQFNYRSFCSATRLYFSFCEIKNARPYPAREQVVLQRGSLSKPGATYGSYINFLRKACFYLGEPTDWLSPAVINVIKSLRLTGETNFRFPNFLGSSSVLKIIRHESPQGGFGHLDYLAYLFALRVPSEALPLRRAYSDDALEGFHLQKGKALIGVRGPPGGQRLILKLSSRKNLQGGCILPRPCFCSLTSESSHKACPIHYFWAHICLRVPSRGKLFSDLLSSKH